MSKKAIVSKAGPKPSIELNRRGFIAWTEGIIMSFKRGKGIALDRHFEKRCEQAAAAMETGETIYLLDDQGKRITQMRDIGDGYAEEQL